MEDMRVFWDFTGPAAEPTARHFLVHLRERCTSEGWPEWPTGMESAGRMHQAVTMDVPADHVQTVRAALRPQRGLPLRSLESVDD